MRRTEPEDGFEKEAADKDGGNCFLSVGQPPLLSLSLSLSLFSMECEYVRILPTSACVQRLIRTDRRMTTDVSLLAKECIF